MWKKLTKEELINHFEKPEVIISLQQEKINYLQWLLSDYKNWKISEEELFKQLKAQEITQEILFNNFLHELNISNLQDKNALNEESLNKILPSIRLQYIRTWKRLIDDKNNLPWALEMEKIIKTFDIILKEKQDRDQKKFTFTILFLFFAIETFLLFTILFLKWFWFLDWLDNSVLQMIIWATIWQVSIMITWIVYYLYPKTKEIN